MLKVVTCVKEASFTQVFNRMFTGRRHRVKRHHSGQISSKQGTAAHPIAYSCVELEEV